MASPRKELLGTVLAGRYELTEIIGEGGMGTVFRGHQLGVGRDVAIKILNPVPLDDYETVAGLFFREARAICQLSHPNTIRLYDFGRTESNELYITMELLRGKVLSEVIKEGGLGLFEVVHIGLSLAEALTEAHDQGIIHRDIKPDNVHIEDKVWDNRFCKILDFGIARVIGQSSESQSPTLRFGTPLYMSPEQILGKSTDARTDIYMLGALLFECLTGHPPFIAKTAVDVCLAHLEAPVPELVRWDSPWQYPPQLNRLIQSMLAKNPEERPESALAVTKALKAISALEHADERTAAIGMAKGEDRGTPIQPGNETREALPRLRMSQSVELTGDFVNRLDTWKGIQTESPTAQRELTRTPQARDPRDLITRISPMQPGVGESADPFAKFDQKARRPDKAADEPRDKPVPKANLQPRGAGASQAPKWVMPVFGGLLIIWVGLMMYLFISRS